MSQAFLLDTNVLSEPLRLNPNPGLLAKLEAHRENLVTATIVWHELLFGCYRLPPSRKRTRIEAYLFDVIGPTIPILGYDTEASVWHATERARLAAEGLMPAFADGQIAAIAQVNECILVTANTSDFAHFQGIDVVNWHLPGEQ